MIRRILVSMSLGASLCLALPAFSVAGSNILFVMDASGSMWGKVDGVSKIVTARESLGKLLQEIPPEMNLGLLSYGLFSKESCDDVHYVVSIGANKQKEISDFINKINPKGKTPIAGALRMAGSHLGQIKGEKHIVLISDGIETCGGDPCQVAGELAKKGINVKIHVVGFDVAAKEREQLECIAKAGGGRYFNADSTAGFKEAVAAVKEAVKAAEAKPAPKPAEPKEYFRDDFNGEELGDHWEVLNPNPDSFIVEKGEMLMVTQAGPATLSSDKLENIVRLTKPLPKGDWTVTMKFKMGYLTGSESAYLALYQDKDNYIGAIVGSRSYYERIRGANMHFYGFKLSKGKEKRFQKPIWGGPGGVPFNADSPPNPYLLRLKKVGRSYIPAVKMLGIKKKDGTESEWIEHEKFTVLRPKGNLAIGIYQSQKVPGETTANIDWIKIETPE